MIISSNLFFLFVQLSCALRNDSGMIQRRYDALLLQAVKEYVRKASSSAVGPTE